MEGVRKQGGQILASTAADVRRIMDTYFCWRDLPIDDVVKVSSFHIEMVRVILQLRCNRIAVSLPWFRSLTCLCVTNYHPCVCTVSYINTSWIPGFARDPLSRSLSPSLSRPSLPSLLFVPAFYPPSLGLPGFAQDNCIPEILFKP